MSTTAPTPLPCRWLDAAQTVGAALSSDGRTLYAIARNGDSLKCECPGWHYRGTCRHITELAAQITTAPRFVCATCGQLPAPEGKYLCRSCAEAGLDEWRARQAAALAALPEIPESTNAEISASAAVYAQTMAAMPEILAAQRNAVATAAHTFIAGTRELASTFEW